MAMPLRSAVAVCSICGEPLKANGNCLACLLRGGLNESIAQSEPLASLVFGDFEIEQRADGFYWELGHGAMGMTYLAMDKVLRRRVALKVIDVPEAARGSQAVRDRFLREARTTAGLRHPNVAAVFQFGASPDASHCYYAMELVEGETLEARVRRDGPLRADSALEIAIQITRALMAAAAHGLIHRDLKPGNVMLTSANVETTGLEVKVIDFGLAKAIADTAGDMDLTHGGFVGTPTFASPEQFRSGPVDARSDIYSLGATLWFALTGLPPRTGSTIEEIRDRQTRADLPVQQLIARKVPEPIIKLLRSTLAVDPAKRPASARELMEMLESSRRKLPHGIGNLYKLAALITIAALAATGYFMFRANRESARSSAKNIASSASALAIPAKSIAVLPFENLSAHPENAFFTDGVQDEILNDLAKIADLKVISRTSVMQYKTGVKRNVREIANALGVAHVVEGSVQRVANRVRVSAQLIDARTDTHVWAEHYDRPIDDVFVIQSQIAKTIADQLKAKLSATEKSAIEERPTKDPAAYDLYVRAKLLVMTPLIAGERWLEAAHLLDQAIARDPDFFLAYCLSAETHSRLYWNFDHTSVRRGLAEEAVKAALHLRPEAGEAHLARAQYLLNCNLDYDNARAELGLAQRTLHNNAQVFTLMGQIDQRHGRWRESARSWKEALELDPGNLFTLRRLALTYQLMRRFAESAATLNHAIALDPQDGGSRVLRAWGDLDWQADPKPLDKTCEAVLKANQDSAAEWGEAWIYLALCERDSAAAERALATIPAGFDMNGLHFPLSLMEGCVARTFGDEAAARKAFTVARVEVERTVREQPDYGPPLCVLGLIDAGLGRKEEAIREGRRATELLPVSKDTLGGALIMQYLGVIYAWTGEKGLAIEQIATTLQVPSRLSYGDLRLHPFWDPLRGDPRFEKLVEEAKKPVAMK